MLGREETFFLQVLSDYINQRKTEIPEGLNWEQIHTYARQHQVEGIFYSQCKKSPMEEKCKNVFVAQIYSYIIRQKLLDEVQKAFSENGIAYIILKGMEVAKFYPSPQLRSMGDIDLIVHTEDMAHARDALVNIGFVFERYTENDWALVKDNNEIELHHALMYEDEFFSSNAQKQYANNIWEYASAGETQKMKLDWTFHMAYLIMHLRKHLMSCGIGFRQFMDIALVGRKANVDWHRLERDLEELDLLKFAQACFTFCERWFGVNFPLGREISDSFFETATLQIFHNGVFGFNNADNDINAVANRIRKDKSSRFRRFKDVMRILFPSYLMMVNYKRYPFLGFLYGRPYLVPIGWICRAFYALTHGDVKIGIKKATASFRGEQIKNREEYLKKWGSI